MRVELRRAGARCCYCHDALGAAAVACTECGTLLHEACQLDACPTWGCDSRTPWVWVELGGAAAARPAGAARRFLEGALLALLALFLQPVAAGVDAAAERRLAPGTAIEVATQWSELEWWARSWFHQHCDGGPGRACRDGCVEKILVGSRIERWRVIYTGEEWARVEAGGYESRITIPVEPPGEGEVLEERSGVVVTVPAGTFVCRYLRCATEADDGAPKTVELWVTPGVPFPVQRIESWQPRHAAAGVTSVWRSVLTRIAPP